MYRRGPFWGGPYMRRRGFPLFPMGGYGMGMGMGGLLGNMVAGGIGYMIGKQSAQQAPQYQPPQTPQYQATAVTPNQQETAASGGNDRLAQLKLLGHLRNSGLLTNDEFEVEKRKIMQGY
jgi:hypothetical protein